ncbi:TIGR04326 family surface carbohydrate biosynthesis protein [Candidatus Njordibacter sp. Uisw_039]|uniref:TIGR04326 family surface carbohydrate biosynthesis protein n=1 Tax=Candidatus Njordibacter sp. Uisw_039 TaxID=3230972 RepID=UPI003D3D9AF0
MSNQSNNESHYLLIWDNQALPKITNGQVALWCSFNDGGSSNTVSIPALVEENSESLRKRYLAWVYALGETKILGSRFVDHLEIRPGFSYWWMTLLVEKCNYAKSPQIDNAIKLMALEEWLVGQTLSRVKLVSANVLLAQCVDTWCVNKGLAFEWQALPAKIEQLKISAVPGTDQAEQVSWARRIYQKVPCNLKALIWLINYLGKRWPLKGVGLHQWNQSKGRVTFFSYLFNLAPDALKMGRFESRYWGHLPDALQHDNCQTNWLHMYVQDSPIKSARKAAKVIREFNVTGKPTQVHVTLDTFLGWRVVFKAIQDWRFVLRVAQKYKYIPVSNTSNTIDFWPLFADDWQQSFIGVGALINLLNLNLYEVALGTLPAQCVGVYLQENQGWESSLINAWQAAGHGNLIGAPHSSVRFWDLRYFFDSRSYDRKLKNNLPMPDQVAVNGSASMSAYLGGEYPTAKLCEVEALRYLYLADYRNETPKTQRRSEAPLKVLVMGDHLLEDMQLQMGLLEQAAKTLPKDTVFIIKPHPACPVNPGHYHQLGMRFSDEPLSILLDDCDIAYSSGITSAAVDAYFAGVAIISVLNLSKLNLSPLRGCAGVVFISTPDELANALMLDFISLVQATGVDDFFFLDATLPRWRDLLDTDNPIKLRNSN